MSLLEVKNLSVHYSTPRGMVKALNGVSLELEKGESLGLLGESGSGKSTLAYAIMGILPSNARIIAGEILFNNNNLLRLSERELNTIRGKKIALIPQNSMSALSPVHRIGDQLVDILKNNVGLSKKEALEKIKEKLKIARLSSNILRMHFHELSGGMRQRVMIAMSLMMDPEIVIADEPTTGLDVIVQYQILRELKSLQKNLNLSLIVISHDVSVIAYTCKKVAVLYGGSVFEYGPSVKIFRDSKNPYTSLLLKSHPDIHSPVEKIVEIPGSPPNMLNPPKGCVFHPRCPFSKTLCKTKQPPLIKVGIDHYTRCHFVKEIFGA